MLFRAVDVSVDVAVRKSFVAVNEAFVAVHEATGPVDFEL